MPMEWVPIRRKKGIPIDLRGPTHQQEHGRYHTQWINTLLDKSTLQERIIDQQRDQVDRLEIKFQSFKDSLREEIAQAVKLAIANANQAQVEDGSTKD
jgi:uncharacterized coiled-coil protein SlyX